MKTLNLHSAIPFFILILFLFSVGCTSPDTSPIGQAEQTWGSQNIDSYGIIVDTINGETGETQTHFITVTDGDVADSFATCTTAAGESCEITPFQGETMTVEGLFRTAKLNRDVPETVILFEDTLGYPTEIQVDDPAVDGDEMTWRVTQFAETQ